MSNAADFHVALIIDKRTFYYIFRVQAILKNKRREHEKVVQCLSSANNSVNNVTSFKILSEEENEKVTSFLRKLCKEDALNVSKIDLHVSKIVETDSLN